MSAQESEPDEEPGASHLKDGVTRTYTVALSKESVRVLEVRGGVV